MEKEAWENHREALSEDKYDELTKYGKTQLSRPRPVWLQEKKRWTVGAPVNPIEWQILVRSEAGQRKKWVSEMDAKIPIQRICGQFRMSKFKFSECIDRLTREHLLRVKGGFKRSKIASKWFHPDLSGRRAGGEWHRNAVHNFVDWITREFGLFSYVDRGYYAGVKMPDAILTKPQLVERLTGYDRFEEPLKWDTQNPVYGEFKSANDMKEHIGRLEKQLDQYQNIPLYLVVEARLETAKELAEEHGRRDVYVSDLLREAKGNMIHLSGEESFQSGRSFDSALKKIKDAFFGTYDAKARLRKTGTDKRGIEHYDMILYDKLGTAENIGQVVPTYADNLKEFLGLYFDRKHLGRIATSDYIYEPEREPTPKRKTWKWRKKKTQGAKFRSFSS